MESLYSCSKVDFDSGSPPQHAWRRKLKSHASVLKEFNVSFMEAFKMMQLGMSYVRDEASHGRRAHIHPFNHEGKPAATQGIPLGGMGFLYHEMVGNKKYASLNSKPRIRIFNMPFT